MLTDMNWPDDHDKCLFLIAIAPMILPSFLGNSPAGKNLFKVRKVTLEQLERYFSDFEQVFDSWEIFK